MAAVTIHDAGTNGALSFDLIDILRVLGGDATGATWRCNDVEATGPLADELHRAADRGDTITGQELLRIAAGVDQVIDGDFRGFTVANEPWLRIRAVDSSLFVVVALDDGVLARLRTAFRDVRDSPEDDA
jgi:hypothetical protein